MVALSRAAQHPLNPLVSSSFFATTSMLLLSGGPHMTGGGGRSMLGTSSCAASFLSLCDSFGLGFATREISPFVCGSTPHTPEDGRPMPLCGSRVLYVITSLSPFGPESATSATPTSPLHAWWIACFSLLRRGHLGTTQHTARAAAFSGQCGGARPGLRATPEQNVHSAWRCRDAPSP